MGRIGGIASMSVIVITLCSPLLGFPGSPEGREDDRRLSDGRGNRRDVRLLGHRFFP